ncbi:MAG: bifunctional 4-hydroxy-2-oxoglutarate aldolase/2-dehydro-3-deoxy-phosphogluconate aldolase [Candidatus Limnocylindria bacterium]
MTDTVRLPVPDAITGPRIIAIARGLDPERLARIADGLLAGGIHAFEITLDSPGALPAIESLARRFDGTPLLVGAGTVLDAAAAAAAAEAGAGFIVSPHGDPAIVGWAVAAGLPVFPGALTPTEIVAMWAAGATAVKIFPASAVGPSFVREVRGPLRHVPLIPTGGITAETAGAWIAAGSTAVGMGSWLSGDGDPAGIAARAGQALAAIADAAT